MFNFKELYAGAALIFLLGMGGFLYRVAIENSYQNVGVCSFETKTCPDGSFVGRSGSACLFSACLPPNVELPNAGISFVLPSGYELLAASSSTPQTRIASYAKKTIINASTTINTIAIYRYNFLKGKTASRVVRAHLPLAALTYSISPKDITNVTFGKNTFSRITLRNSATVLRSAYYVIRGHYVFLFYVTQNGGIGTASNSTKVNKISGNKELRTLLSTLQFSS